VSGIAFVKAHACGNDFLIIEESVVRGSAAALSNHAAMARRLCARNTGIGADGIEFLDRRVDGSLFLRLFNADGREAELSGNGTRCVAAWLAQSESREQVALGTHGGVRTCRVVRREEDRGATWWIESGMGVPRVMRRTIEIAAGDGTGVKMEVEGAMVNVGNPHFVIFTEREDFGWQGNGGVMSWQELGAKISVDPLFRFGTNVEFVRVQARDEIAFRIYERGCGPTMSSGTGTCASSAASMVLHDVARELNAVAEGGSQHVVWPDDASEMMLTGPAEIICTGEAAVGC
jgi:diaminopimelate epimerase